MGRIRSVVLATAAIVLAGALVYANGVTAPFTFDDDVAIVGNTSIRQLGDALAPPDRGEPVAGRPIVNLSFALNYAAGGLDVRGYHVVNIALHIACALLLFALVRLTLRHAGAEAPALRAMKPRRHEDAPGTGVAFVCALLWVVHPLNSETVNYISQRTESLMALFYLLTLYASARATLSRRVQGSDPATPRHRGQTPVHGDSRLWIAVAVIACAAGMACKETMATAPLVVMLYDRTLLFGSFAEAWRARRRFYLALAGTWALLLALIWSGPRWESAGFSTGISPWTYLLNQAVMVVEYLRRAAWPRSLVLDYGEPVPYALGDVLPQAVLVVALLAATGWALIKGLHLPAEAGSHIHTTRRSLGVVGFLGACFFIILAPTSSFIPIATEAGAERRMYLPLAALIVLAVLAGRKVLARMSASAGVAALVAAAAAAPLAAGTVQRNTEYLDGLTLWSTTLERWPSARAHRNVATELKRAGRGEEAVVHLRQAITDHPEGRYALGYELYEQRRYAEAAAELKQFIRDYPTDSNLVTAHMLIADSLRAEEQYAAAVEHYQAIVKARPAAVPMWIGLGFALASSGQTGAAESALRRAVELAPRNAVAHMTLGLVLAAQGRLDDASTHLRTAIEIDPANTEARQHLSRIEELRAGGAR